MNSRWQIYRVGLVDFWYYRDGAGMAQQPARRQRLGSICNYAEFYSPAA